MSNGYSAEFSQYANVGRGRSEMGRGRGEMGRGRGEMGRGRGEMGRGRGEMGRGRGEMGRGKGESKRDGSEGTKSAYVGGRGNVKDYVGGRGNGGGYVGGRGNGRNYVGGRGNGREYVGGRGNGRDYVGGRGNGGGYVGGRGNGRNYVGGRGNGREYVGGRDNGGDYVGGRGNGKDCVGGRGNDRDYVGGSNRRNGSRNQWDQGNERRGFSNQSGLPTNKPALYVRRASVDDLKNLLEVSDNEALLRLLDPTSGLLKMFESSTLSDDMMEVCVSVILKSARAEDARYAIRQLMTSLCDVRFLDLHLVDHVKKVGLSRASSVIELCHVLISVVPTCSLKHVSLLLTALKNSAKNVDLKNGQQPLDRLKEAEDEFDDMRKARSQGDVMRDEEDEEECDVIPPDDFRKIPTIPTLIEIFSDQTPFLRKNIIYGAYKSADHYLDVQYRLLREDFVFPLRNAIRNLQNAAEKEKPVKKQADIIVYHKVKILMPYCTQKGIMYKVQFDVSQLKRVNWESSKRLMSGSLVVLSKDGFYNFTFGTVAEGIPEELANGVVHLMFDESSCLDLDPNPFTEYEMLESSAYFEAYRHVLEGLKEMSETDLPFQNYLLNQCSPHRQEVQPPLYLRSMDVRYDFRVCLDEDQLESGPEKWKSVPVLRSEEWPTEEDLHLDQSQYSALRTALTKEFSVIQGPPGTGKTFVGLKIAQLLLHNRQAWVDEKGTTSPILVVCYTNHALDQFLGGILDLCKLNVGELIRVGGQVSAENERLQQCTLKELQKIRVADAQIKQLKPLLHQVKNSMNYIESQITILSAEMNCARTQIIHEQHLHRYMTTAQSQSLVNASTTWKTSALPQWLELSRREKSSTPEINDQGKMGDSDIQGADRIDAQRKEHLNQISDMSRKLASRLGLNDDWELPRAASEGLHEDVMRREEALLVGDVWGLSGRDRWRLYRHWLSMFCQERAEATRAHNEQFNQLAGYLSELTREQEYTMLAQAHVIGMTTTGAAKYRRLIHRVQPRIVIVEEAAEVLESHIVTTLSNRCEQLIMIGDHQQLRPNPTVYKLAKEFHLDISLFERMVKNNIHCEKLRIQHRMRPEIASLIVPHIYKDLTNHESVENYPDIQGVGGNVFFINHSEGEQCSEDRYSRSNVHEAEYIAGLVKYLLLQGYEQYQITVLTAYSGQMFLVRRSMEEWNSVRVTTIDAYQGEENDIVILSLVRSNEEGNIGFLQTHNRVCVALSRARWGLFVIGDMRLLREASPMWKSIVKHLKSKSQIVDALPLFCHNHPDTKILARVSDDFKAAPEGGCTKDCGFEMDCGHVCERKCHPVDSEHEFDVCLKPCSAILCPLQHQCPLPCHEVCPECSVLVEKIIPGCGHQQMVPCSISEEDFHCEKPCEKILECGHACQESCGSAQCTSQCKVVVEREWPCLHRLSVPCYQNVETSPCSIIVMKDLPCGHSAEVKCSTDIEKYRCEVVIQVQLCDNSTHISDIKCCEKGDEMAGRCEYSVQKICPLDSDHLYTMKCHESQAARCPLSCTTVLDCGHGCSGSCGSCGTSESHQPCQRLCERVLPCGHKCRSKCSSVCPPCIEKCSLFCGHQQCDLKCHDECRKCELGCKWSCEHDKCRLSCHEPCIRAPCNKPCKRTLLCSRNHLCIGLCGELCPKLCRICHEEDLKEILINQGGPALTRNTRFVSLETCGHVVEVDTMDNWVKSTELVPPCEILPLTCPVCSQMVLNCPRYNNRIKTYMMLMNQTKQSDKSSDRVKHTLSCAMNSIWDNSPPSLLQDLMKMPDSDLHVPSDENLLRKFSIGALCLYQECANLSALCVKKRAQVSEFLDILDEFRTEVGKKVEGRNVKGLAKLVVKLSQLFICFHVQRFLVFIKNPKRIDDLLNIYDEFHPEKDVELVEIRSICKKISQKFSLQQRENIEDYFDYLYDHLDPNIQDLDCARVGRICSKGHVFSYAVSQSLCMEDMEKLCLKCHPPTTTSERKESVEELNDLINDLICETSSTYPSI